MKTTMNKQTFASRVAKTNHAITKAQRNGTYIDPLIAPDESAFHVVAASQRAAVKWIGRMCDEYNAALEAKKHKDYWILPVIEGQTQTETLRQLVTVCRSAFIHRSMTYDIAKASVLAVREAEISREVAAELVEWLRVFGLFTPENDVNRTHICPTTNAIVKSQPTAVLSQDGLRILWNSLYEDSLKQVSLESPELATEEQAIRTSHVAKEGSSVIHSRFVKNESVAGEQAVKSLDAFAQVGLKLHPDMQAALAHWFALESKAKKNETPDAHHERLEIVRKQYGRIACEVERIGGETFFVKKAYDYRGRMYDASGELSFQGLKAFRGLISFADAMPVNEWEINVAKGRMYFESIGDKLKYSDEHCAEHGAAWDGKNPDGSPCMSAAVLFTDPARALVSLDANQQGFQMLALAFGDRALAILTNIIGDKRYDLYGHVAKMLQLPSRDHAKVWLIPYVYGAGTKALTRDFNSWAEKKNQPLVDEVTMHSWVERFEAAFPAANGLKGFLSNAFRDACNLPDTFEWTLPDGFTVKYSAWEVKNLNISAGVVKDFKIRLKSTWSRSHDAMVQGLAPNIVHSLDGWMLREVQRRCNFPVVPVHDSYSCHSYNIPALRQTIIEVMQDIADMNLLDSIVSQLIVDKGYEGKEGSFFSTIEPKEVGSMGNYPLAKEVIVNPYMFM